MSSIITGAEIYLPRLTSLNVEEELVCLDKELAKWQKNWIWSVRSSNERFVANAKPEVVQKNAINSRLPSEVRRDRSTIDRDEEVGEINTETRRYAVFWYNEINIY